MSLFDEKTKPYDFSSGINDFLQELEQPKEEMHIPIVPSDVPETVEPTPDGGASVETEKITMASAKKTANNAIILIDGFQAEGCSLISKEKSENYHFDRDTSDGLADLLAVYLKEKGVKDLPPGWLFLIALLIAVGGNIKRAFDDRKKNEEIEKLKKQNAELESKYNELLKEKDNGNDSPQN